MLAPKSLSAVIRISCRSTKSTAANISTIHSATLYSINIGTMRYGRDCSYERYSIQGAYERSRRYRYGSSAIAEPASKSNPHPVFISARTMVSNVYCPVPHIHHLVYYRGGRARRCRVHALG